MAGIDVLIGPEGGFAEDERELLMRQTHVARLSLGPASCAPTLRPSPPWRWCRRCLVNGPVPVLPDGGCR